MNFQPLHQSERLPQTAGCLSQQQIFLHRQVIVPWKSCKLQFKLLSLIARIPLLLKRRSKAKTYSISAFSIILFVITICIFIFLCITYGIYIYMKKDNITKELVRTKMEAIYIYIYIYKYIQGWLQHMLSWRSRIPGTYYMRWWAVWPISKSLNVKYWGFNSIQYLLL